MRRAAINLALRWLHVRISLQQRDKSDTGNLLTGWLGFLMYHDIQFCDEVFHKKFCLRLQPYKPLYREYLRQHDKDFTHKFMNMPLINAN